MGFQISPGVNISEIDLTTIVPSISTTDGGFVGVFNWGPLEDVVLIGNETKLIDNFGKPDINTASSYFTAANFLSYGDKLRLVRVASTSNEEYVVNCDVSGTTLTNNEPGSFDFEEILSKGSSVTDGVNTATVISITSATVAVLSSSALDGADDVDLTITTYVGSLNATSEFGTGSGEAGEGILIKNESYYENNYSSGLADVGPFAAKYPGSLGNSLKVSLCPSENAYSQSIANVAATGTALTGTGTAFLTTLEVGTIIKHPTNGEERKISSITDDTNAVLESAFSLDFTSTTVVAEWEYANAIGIAPNTSDYVSGKSGVNDELHIVVIDEDGDFTGTPGEVLEKLSFLSKASDGKSDDGASTYYVNAIKNQSKYIFWTDHIPAGINWGSSSQNTTFTAVNKPYTYSLSGGRDVNTGSDITAAKINGYDLFKDPDIIDVAILMTGEANTEVCVHVINNICEVRKDCVVCISPEKDDVVDNLGDEVTDTIEFRETLPSSSYAIMDSGWKYQYDKHNDVYRWIPLNGDIAGLLVRTDVNNDPWFSPAGFNRGNIKNVIRLAYNPIRAERDDLYSKGINSVVNFQGEGTLLYGDKTLLAKPSAFDRINVRRLFIVLEKSISRAAKLMLFEFNDEFTRVKFKNLIEPYLRDVQGRRGIYDFRVVADSTNNTPEVIDRNEFIGDIYVKPSRSINFIQLNFVAVRSGVEFSEIVGKF